MKISIKSIPTITLLFSTVFYIKYFLIKPVYILLFVLVFLAYMSNKYILTIRYFIIGLLFQLFLIYHLLFLDSDMGMILNACLSILAFPVLSFYIQKANINTIKSFFNICILFFSVEGLWRLTNPIYVIENRDVLPEDGSGWFYPYKLNSFIFQDSNYVALHLFCLFFIALVLKLNWKAFLLFILIVLTFSRAVILGAMLAFILLLIVNSQYFKYLKAVMLVSIVSFIAYFVIVFEQIAQGSLIMDGSFLTKFSIINSAIYYANNYFTLYDYLFGVGLSHSYDLIDRGAHNIFVVLLFETGIIGSLFYFLYLSSLLSKVYMKGKQLHYCMLFMGVFLLMGFSLGLYLFPVMVLAFAFLAKTQNMLEK